MLNKLLIYLITVLTYNGSNDPHCEHDYTKADLNLKGNATQYQFGSHQADPSSG